MGTGPKALSSVAGVSERSLHEWKDEVRGVDLNAASNAANGPESAAIAAKKNVIERVNAIRSRYLDRADQEKAIADTSGFYAVLAVKHLTDIHQLLTGGPTHRIDLATFLSHKDDDAA